ncbi:VOC family protein [Thalassobacillus sp. CUG 92003]|uniref:VOC family protein n=1 Tax=Thalassobacillus sp. CUG 92003 TaxID=2736641 RepID=UPI0015E65889|nr:VOC family protein [Thalassobacillus sp. CUG 92003]
MQSYLKRVGTTYIPVSNVEAASEWYQEKLGAVENFRNEDKAILDFADQSFFLVKSQEGQQAQFIDHRGDEHFSLTFEVDGWENLKRFHEDLNDNGVTVGEIEDRGHPGNNFVFYDLDRNAFDVWSEWSGK